MVVGGDDGCGCRFTADSRSLVTTDGKVVTVWDLADFRRVNSWPRPRPAEGGAGAEDLVVAPYGRRAIVHDGDRNRPILIDLDTGLQAPLPLVVGDRLHADPMDAPEVLDFCPDGRTYLQLTRMPDQDTPALCIKDLVTGAERFVSLGLEAGMVRCCDDGRSAVVALHDRVSGVGVVQVIDLARAEKGRAFTIGPMPNFKYLGVHPSGHCVAVSAAGVVSGQGDRQFQLWDLADGRQIATFPARLARGWNSDGNVLTFHSVLALNWRDDGTRVFDRSGTEVGHWLPPQGPGSPIFLAPSGRFLFWWDYFKVPAWRTWLHQRFPWLHRRFPRLISPFDSIQIHVHDACTGRLRASVTSMGPAQLIQLSPDGQTLAASVSGLISVWDIPPRTPGGIVLGQMIGEVAIVIAWTAWRRRKRKRFQVVAP
jgi:WD40 repeat protein